MGKSQGKGYQSSLAKVESAQHSVHPTRESRGAKSIIQIKEGCEARARVTQTVGTHPAFERGLMFQVYVIRLLCAILDLLLFPNMRDAQTMKDKQFLWSSALSYATHLERERIGQDE